MRKRARRTTEEAAWELLGTAPAVHLASTTPDGAPLVRVLNAALAPGRMLFHGAIFGEKSSCIGRPAVVSAFREVAFVPSYFRDAHKACPATTLYRSALAYGVLRDVEDHAAKAEALEALMQKHQPEGGYVPLTPGESLYEKDYRSTRVFELVVERVEGKASLCQDRPVAVRDAVLSGLWDRGAPEDSDAIREILEESPHPWPERFLAPGGVELLTAPRGEELREHALLLAGHYWRQGVSPEGIERSLRGSAVWVGARDPEGRLVGAARALTDTAWVASIHDVVVHPDVQGRGIGRSLVALLLDHARLRRCANIHLGTADKEHFYARFGFVPSKDVPRPYPTTSMTLLRESTSGR
jgi:N-acetylglutamate synthase-like GNAT family acetyltransferase/nitroimidazol reductase NimA-like FMN-containing flavoprotein (pyridoxamine 5'-phosphate oxidase superfamily)